LSEFEILPAADGSYTDLVLAYENPVGLSNTELKLPNVTVRLEGVVDLSSDQIVVRHSDDTGDTDLVIEEATASDDSVVVRSGSYYLTGDGADTLNVSDGIVEGHLGAGDDTAEINGGTVLLAGGEGNDVFSVASDGTGGAATIFGGLGEDFISVASGQADAHGGQGDDILIAERGSAASVHLIGGGGDDQITLSMGQSANTGFGHDTVTLNIYPENIGGEAAQVSDHAYYGAENPEFTQYTINLPPEVTGELVFEQSFVGPDYEANAVMSVMTEDGTVLLRVVAGEDGPLEDTFVINRDVVFPA